jgi:hypothetical protein
MKRIEVVQGSAEWHDLRLGMPTASEFHKIVTPGGKLSAQARKYAVRIVTEKLLRRSLDSLEGLEWVERGKATEPEAVRLYEFLQETTLLPGGYCTSDDGRMGASPDRFVSDGKGIVEVKCPSPAVHVMYLVDGPGDDYRPQVQGQLMITGLEYVDFFSYSPEMPPVKIRIEPDFAYLRILRPALTAFCDMRDEVEAAVRAAGYFEERAKLLMPQDVAYGDRVED